MILVAGIFYYFRCIFMAQRIWRACFARPHTVVGTCEKQGAQGSSGGKMFRVNDYVVYGSTGVCKIDAINREDFGDGREREYYVLTAIYANSLSIYIPTDNTDAAMRRIMTKDEIYELINSILKEISK